VKSKMTRAPVFYTLAQVQFNPIAQMSDYVAAIQERLRRSGFPDFRPENQLEILFRQVEGLQPSIQQQQQMRWSFMNAQRTEGYLLSTNVLVFHTTAYDTFEDFLQKTISGLRLIHEILELTYVERIGLRYLDAIVAMGDDNLQQYLNPSLLGLSGNLEGNLSHSFNETVSTIGEGTLVARSFITEGGLAISPDLLPLQLELSSRFTTIKDRNAVMDTDYFIAKRSDFDIAVVKDQLLLAHDFLMAAFKAAVTDYARQTWGITS
jgi:uncharacterized protein (TIGR04255 family)